MMPAIDRRLLTLVASAILAFGVPLALLWPEQEPLPSADWPTPTPFAGNSLKAADASGRNLFVAAPSNIDPSVTPAPAEPPKLLGVALRLRGRGVAVVRLASGETENLNIGDIADGWTLVALTSKGATFTGPSGSTTVSLDFGNRTPAPGSPASPSPPGTGPLPQRTS